VQLLMDLHGTGLERIMEVVFQSGEGGAKIIDDLGQDPLVSSLLVLYGLHPDDLQTRVERKLKQMVSKLHKMGAEARLVDVVDGKVRLRATVNTHSCGSTTRTLQATLEEAIYEAAPDLSSLVIEGLEEPTAPGFVALEKLLGAYPTASAPSDQPAVLSDGMD
jgi:Fe-S cluster biogenesis protein NfuA